MEYKTILENWKKFTQSTKPLTLIERREIMNEISKNAAEKIYDWMRDTDGLPYDFDEIFGDNMRVALPMDSHDTRMLKSILRAIKEEGWLPPISDSARERQRSIYSYEKGQETGQVYNPDGGEWEPTKEEWKAWEASDAPERGFPTKKAKQKRQRLAAEGGGEYEVEINVADLGLERRVEQVIPKGPRAGEKITKVQKQGINKVIGGLEKKGKLAAGAAEWWTKNQTHYTKDQNHKKIQTGLSDEGQTHHREDMHVILSRHPIDVLRMSDISNIHSCHSEGSDYFKCAVAEAKGHGPIAYAVTEAELNKLLKPSEERERPIAKLDRMYQELGQAERITAIRQDYDTETPEGALMLLWVWARTNTGTKWWNGMEKKVEMASKPEKFKEVMLLAQAKALNISPLLFKQYVKNYEKYEARGPGSHPDLFKPWEGITSEEEYKAALEKHSKEATRAPDPRDIGDLDDEEIFRDHDRDVPGIGVKARVRLRKYVDDPNSLTFAAPESRTYGTAVPGFVGAVREYVWEKQKEMFAQELGDVDPESGKGEATTYFIPEKSYLTRHGGSYGDTRDGEILNMFFGIEARGGDLPDPYNDGMDVHHDADDEEESENEQMNDEYESAAEDLNEAANDLEHASFYADVYWEEAEYPPQVQASGDLTLTIPLGWGDDGEGNDVHPTYDIPQSYNDKGYRDFENLLDFGEYPEETDWNHTEDGLEINYRFNCEDCTTPDDADYFLDHMRDLDGKYDQFYEKVRRKLVEEGFAKPSAWDDTQNEIEDFEDRLKNFNIIGDDDDDPTGEIWFNLGHGAHNSDYEMPLNLTYPASEMYWLAKHPNIFGGARNPRHIEPAGLMAKALSGRRESGSWVWVGSDTNSSYAKFFAERLKKLEAAANGYAKTQIDLPFGDKYASPKYEGISFAKDVQIALRFGTAESVAKQSANQPIFFRLKIVAMSKDSKEELEGAFHFVEFVDKHVDMVMQAAKEVTQEFALTPNLEIAQELKREYLGADYAMELSKMIMKDYAYDAMGIQQSHHRAIVEWWSNGDVYSKMNEFEKEVLIEKYLKPMSQGMGASRWEVGAHLPNGWGRNVDAWMADANIPHSLRRGANGEHLKSPEITKKFFGTEDEREAKRKEEDIEMYVKRQEQSMGRRMTPEEIEAIRDTYKEPAGTLRGTLGEPREAGAPRMTEREKAIEELTAAFNGRAPTEEEIEDLLRRRAERASAVDERVAYLKKALTEAKIRANIRKVLRETE